MFETRRLRLLHELAQRGTIAAVAEALSYSPSTVSQQLAVLEREAGVPLLEADGRRVRLTPQGRTLARHAAAMLNADEAVRAALVADHAEHITLRVAAIHTSIHPLVSAALAALREAEPGIDVTVTATAPEHGLTELRARGFDLVIAEQYPGATRGYSPDLERDLLGLDPIALAVPPHLAASSLADVRAMPWVMEPEGTASRQWATQQCRAAGFEPEVVFEVADPQIHMQLIADGHAVGLLPGLVWSRGAPVRVVQLSDSPSRELFAATRAASAGSVPLAALRRALRESLLALQGAD